MSWDRKQFDSTRLEIIQQLGQDEELKRIGQEFLKSSYKKDYCYQWDWLGFPILQMPEDIVVLQEILFRCKPSLVIEAGVAWGGGLALVASVMSMYRPDGIVVGVDLNLNPDLASNFASLKFPVAVKLLEGSSVDDTVIAQLEALIRPSDKVMVILDSSHSHDHVLEELSIYSRLVSSGQYLIVGDTSVKDLAGQTKRSRPWNHLKNPHSALVEFLSTDSTFSPDISLDAKLLSSFHPGGYLRKN